MVISKYMNSKMAFQRKAVLFHVLLIRKEEIVSQIIIPVHTFSIHPPEAF